MNEQPNEAELQKALQAKWDRFCAEVHDEFPTIDALLLVPVWTLTSKKLPDVLIGSRVGFIGHIGNLFRAAQQTLRAHFQVTTLVAEYLQTLDNDAARIGKVLSNNGESSS